MRWRMIFSCCLLAACGDTVEKVDATPVENTVRSTTDTPADTTAQVINDTAAHASYLPPETKKPSGIYRFRLPYEGGEQILHTVAFYPGTFQLQEAYGSREDSVVVINGTWAPSQGYIWMYRDHVVRGRYRWLGDTLQYYSPRLKRFFSLERLSPVLQNAAWQDRKRAGATMFATGTEPFWSVEITRRDSLVFSMPDWTMPLRTKITSQSVDGDRRFFEAAADSISVMMLPFFCNDGMSDYVYTRRIVVKHRGKTYHGCGELF